jgi:hypothetical protein
MPRLRIAGAQNGTPSRQNPHEPSYSTQPTGAGFSAGVFMAFH